MAVVVRSRRDLDLDDLEDELEDRWHEFTGRRGGAASSWVWVGVIALVMVVLISVILICFCCCRRRRRGKVLRAKPITQVPTISVTHPSSPHITETETTATTAVSQQKEASQPSPPAPSGYPHPPVSGYMAQPAGYYPFPQPAPPYAPSGPHGMPPPYDGHQQQPAYNPAFHPGPGDVVTPM